MKRYKFTLAMVIAGMMLVIPASFTGTVSASMVLKTDAPAPVNPKPVPPVCTFLTDPAGKIVQPKPTGKGIANRGICRDKSGNKVWGTQFSYTDLTVTGRADTSCSVKKDFGTVGQTGVIPITLKGVAVSYSITVWVPKTTKHLASNWRDPRSTTNFTVQMPGKAATCDGNPTFIGDPNSPDGGGKPGTADGGFACGWGGSKQLAVTSEAVSMPTIFDCSGNGVCTWSLIGRSGVRYGITFYPGYFSCANNVKGDPFLYLEVTRLDGSPCEISIDGVTSFPLLKGWGGTINKVTALILTTYWGPTFEFPRLFYTGPLNGTPGGPSLC